MRQSTIAALAVLAALGARAGEPVKTKTPSQTVAEHVTFTAPKGWTPEEYANSGGADPVVRYENLSDSLVVRVFGAPGSAYATPNDFMAGPAASSLGSPPEAEGFVAAGGKKLKAWKRRWPIVPSDPHGHAAPALYGVERFAVLPLSGARFAVLSWQRASPAPDLQRTGEKAWAEFLKTARPAKAKKTR
jgi:hypothetical protein